MPAPLRADRTRPRPPPASRSPARRGVRPARTSPIAVHPSGRTAVGGNVASSAWSSPPVSTQAIGSTPSADPTCCSGPAGSRQARTSAARSRSTTTRLSTAMCPASASSPSLTSHIAVRARVRSGRARPRTAASGRRWAATAAIGLANPRRSTASPHGRPAQPAGQRHDVAGPRPGAQHRQPPRQVAQRRHRQHHRRAVGGRRHRVPADDGGAQRRALLGQPGRDALQPARRACPAGRPGRRAARWPRRPSPRRRPGWPPPPCARCPPRRTSPAGSAAPRRGRRWSPTTRPSGARSDGGVVARARPRRPARYPPGEHPGDHAELADDAHAVGRIPAGNERAGPSHRPHPAAAVGCRTDRHPAGTTYGSAARGRVSRGPRLHPDPDRSRQGRPGRHRPSPRSTASPRPRTSPAPTTSSSAPRPRRVDELGRLVVARVQSVDGITRTLTCPVVNI